MLTAPHFETCLKLSGEAWEFEKREYKQTVTNPRSFQIVQECYMPVQGRLMREHLTDPSPHQWAGHAGSYFIP